MEKGYNPEPWYYYLDEPRLQLRGLFWVLYSDNNNLDNLGVNCSDHHSPVKIFIMQCAYLAVSCP